MLGHAARLGRVALRAASSRKTDQVGHGPEQRLVLGPVMPAAASRSVCGCCHARRRLPRGRALATTGCPCGHPRTATGCTPRRRSASCAANRCPHPGRRPARPGTGALVHGIWHTRPTGCGEKRAPRTGACRGPLQRPRPPPHWTGRAAAAAARPGSLSIARDLSSAVQASYQAKPVRNVSAEMRAESQGRHRRSSGHALMTRVRRPLACGLRRCRDSRCVSGYRTAPDASTTVLNTPRQRRRRPEWRA